MATPETSPGNIEPTTAEEIAELEVQDIEATFELIKAGRRDIKQKELPALALPPEADEQRKMVVYHGNVEAYGLVLARLPAHGFAVDMDNGIAYYVDASTADSLVATPISKDGITRQFIQRTFDTPEGPVALNYLKEADLSRFK